MLYKLRFVSGLNLPWYGSMEWNMEENLVWNERKLPLWNMENRLLFNFIACPGKKDIALIFLYLTSHGLF